MEQQEQHVYRTRLAALHDRLAEDLPVVQWIPDPALRRAVQCDLVRLWDHLGEALHDAAASQDTGSKAGPSDNVSDASAEFMTPVNVDTNVGIVQGDSASHRKDDA